MAFTNAPKITLVSDNVVRLSVSDVVEATFGLVAGATGQIGLHGSGAEVELPAAFKPGDYGNAIAKKVDLQSSIQVMVVPQNNASEASLIGYTVNKSGTTPADFLIEIANTGSALAEDPTLDFEIYIRFH